VRRALLIIARHDPLTYRTLKQSFACHADIDVTLDRRCPNDVGWSCRLKWIAECENGVISVGSQHLLPPAQHFQRT